MNTSPSLANIWPRPPRWAQDRRDILWIGGEVPASLTVSCDSSSFRVVPTAASVEAVESCASSARGLIVEVDAVGGSADPAWQSQLVAVAHRHGLAVALTHPANADPLTCYEAARRLEDPFRVHPPVIGPRRDWSEVTQAFVRHDPGPGIYTELALQGDVLPTDEVCVLLRRAFHDLDQVHVDQIVPGKSGAAVFVVSATGMRARDLPHPFLVKVHAITKIREERDKLADHVNRLVLPRYRPAVYDERCVEGEIVALLVQSYEDGVKLLEAVVRERGNAAAYANALFSTALRPLHTSGGIITESLSQAFRDLKALRWARQPLTDAAECARGVDSTLPTLSELRALLDALPPMTHRSGHVHGDLHAQNIFARSASADVIVFDFANAMRGPAVADAACLEVSLTFPPRDSGGGSTGPALDASWLREIFRYPLEAAQIDQAPGLPGIAGRDREAISDALRAVRSEARKRDQSQTVYAVAVASYLLRYSSFDEYTVLQERAFAYDLACRLLEAVDRQVTMERDAVEPRMVVHG